ncbi:MAG: hypothetical protein LBS24_04480 [Clostridiales Family XIII bacterium]|jgi:hypothetical protein|nr:hypothetical protein [Clostridiales Family XIII bacterium]
MGARTRESPEGEHENRAGIPETHESDAMLYKGESGEADISWRRFQREWLRPQIVAAKMGGCSKMTRDEIW